MHQELKTDLKEKNISHAYLLYGEKDEILKDAMDFALSLNCKNPKNSMPCGKCRPCTLGKNECFSDFTVIRPEKTTYLIKQIRDLIKTVQFSAQEGEFRIFMIIDADKLTEVCANALLKTLEEPVENTVFLLLSTNGDKTLATIESRCRILRYNGEVKTLKSENLEEAFELLTSLPQNNMDYLLLTAETYAKEKNKETDREKLKTIIAAMAEILSRNYGYRVSHTGEASYLLNSSEFGDDILLKLWEETNKAMMYLEYQLTTRLVAENLFLAIKEKNRVN
ncbi:MAG: hypothetical protein RRY24_05745 [Clostridiales bacterium]